MAFEDLFDMSDCTLDNYSPLMMVPMPLSEKQDKREMVDMRPYYRTKQRDVAHMFGMSSSLLSKKWHLASNDEQWPFRRLLKYEAGIKHAKDAAERAEWQREYDNLINMHVEINICPCYF